MALPTIPDELLAEILLRLPTPCDVISASRVCVSFRRVVADRSFLRRIRKLHAPPLLGFLVETRFEKLRHFHPTIVPYPSTLAANNSIALAADFSFSFLPAGDWAVHDIRDGRVLLRGSTHDGGPFFAEIVVCDPLHRRYLLLPTIPGDLVALMENATLIRRRRVYETFFMPPGGSDDDDEDTSFRVICMAMCKTKLVTFVFSSSDAQWRAGPSLSWSDLFPGVLFMCVEEFPFSRRHYANGCFYWLINWREKLLVLDTRGMEFSSVDAPPVSRLFSSGDISIVEEGEDTTVMFVRASDTSSYHKYTVRRNSDGSYSQWDMVNTMSLDSAYFFIGSMRRCVLLYKYGMDEPLDAGCFSLDIKTFQLERVCAAKPSVPGISNIHIYRNFPPSLLSTSTISSGRYNSAYVLGRYKKLHDCSDAEEAEAYALLYALKKCEELQFQPLFVETDCANVIKRTEAHSPDISTRCAVYRELQSWRRKAGPVNLVHVKRVCNQVAHHMANLSAVHGVCGVWDHDIPELVIPYVVNDVSLCANI